MKANGRARLGVAGHGWAWRGAAGHGEGKAPSILEGAARQGMAGARCGQARLGVAWETTFKRGTMQTMKRFEVSIEGMTPLIMHNNNLIARDAIAAKGRKGGKPGDDRTPAGMWKAGLYLDDTHGICLPVENLLAALLKAGSGISIGRMKTLKSASTGIVFSAFALPLIVDGKPITKAQVDAIDDDTNSFADHCDGARKLGFELFVKPVSVNGKSHVRVRPRFSTWAAKAFFSTDNADLLSGDDRIESIWHGAGQAGVGDWRPSSPKKPGMYGTFRATVKPLR